jgi:hypothetical protein
MKHFKLLKQVASLTGTLDKKYLTELKRAYKYMNDEERSKFILAVRNKLDVFNNKIKPTAGNN